MKLYPLPLARRAAWYLTAVGGGFLAVWGPGAAAQAPPPSPPRGLDCAAATDQANAADLKAFDAQAAKAEASALAPLVDGAASAWQAAVEHCDGRARERALRNLDDSRKMRAAMGELPADLQLCEATQKDAAAMQRLARRAVDERRWPDAVALYRKTEGFWELASERCSGSRQQAAVKQREQAAVDGFNAGSCEPLAVPLRQAAEQFRSASAKLPPAERRQQSQALEARWRELAKACQGGAQGIALVEADLLLNEREPPWAAGAGSGVAPRLATPAEGSPAPAARLAAAAQPSSAAAEPSSADIDVTLADNTRLQGRFTRDADSQSYSGTGRIAWANGDVYQGEVSHGQGHGRGQFTWPSGQTFDGEWVHGHPQGRGVMRFVNGNVYQGPVDGGVPVGVGEMRYASGDSYQGAFAAGVPHGEGLYTWRSGQSCQCTWLAGQATGTGQLRSATGDLYTGPLQDGRPQGRGEMRYASGDVYQGDFAAGLSEGQGSYSWKNGDRYVGGWRQGVKEGAGKMSWAGGEQFEGEFRAGVQVEPLSAAPLPARR